MSEILFGRIVSLFCYRLMSSRFLFFLSKFFLTAKYMIKYLKEVVITSVLEQYSPCLGLAGLCKIAPI